VGAVTDGKVLGTFAGITLIEHPDTTVSARKDAETVGYAWPAILAQPDGAWFARFRGRDAVKFNSRHAALRHLVGRHPDCVCAPVNCAEDDPSERF
jgi:hypothetical protein